MMRLVGENDASGYIREVKQTILVATLKGVLDLVHESSHVGCVKSLFKK